MTSMRPKDDVSEHSKIFYQLQLQNDAYRGTAEDPFGNPAFIAAVAAGFGPPNAVDTHTHRATKVTVVNLVQLAFVSFKVGISVLISIIVS